MTGSPLDLDARRAEHGGGAKPVKLGGKVWELPPKMPILFAGYLAKGDFEAAIDMLFGVGAVKEIGHLVDLDTLEAISEELYGEEMGELQASPKPSKRTGTASRPTSRASTRRR